MVDGMIERVARELCVNEHPDQSREWHDDAWTDWKPLAKRIVATMRIPDPKMIALGGNALRGQTATEPSTPDAVLARHTYTAMIDAALAEEA